MAKNQIQDISSFFFMKEIKAVVCLAFYFKYLFGHHLVQRLYWTRIFIVALGTFLLTTTSCTFAESNDSTKLLVFTKTAGFRHKSISAGQSAIFKIGVENNFHIDTTEDAAYFNYENLIQYDAIIFLSTTGDVLDSIQEKAFEQYIQNGGGFVGIHAATDTEFDWPWYNGLVGAYFSDHPPIQEADLIVKDGNHISTQHLPKIWHRKDEWYNFKSMSNQIKTLVTIDETTYTGGKMGKMHPMSWYHEYDGGRAWYTALGHTEASFEEEKFINHLTGGILFAINKQKE